MLREAVADDLNGIRSLADEWLHESGEELSFSHENFISVVLGYVASPDFHIYVLEYENLIVGVGVISLQSLLFREKIARLEWFYIHSCIRGTGMGAALAKFLRDLSLQKGARIMIADTIFARHARVFKNMFKKLGFKEAGYTMMYRSY